MKVSGIISASIAVVSMVLVILAAVQGLSALYVIAGLVLVIAVLALVRSFGRTRGRKLALSGIALIALAALVVAPIMLNTTRNPVLAYAPDDDARWVSDGEDGGYVVTTNTIDHLDASGDVVWARAAMIATWTTPDGLITSDRDNVRVMAADGEVVWEVTAFGLGGDTAAPVAWNDGVTTVAVCDNVYEAVGAVPCRFIGIDVSGDKVFTIAARFRTTTYPGGLFHFSNLVGKGATGALPSYFGYALADDADVTVADSADGRTVTTVPTGEDLVLPALVGDRVLTGAMANDACTMSALPTPGVSGWETEVPCLSYADEVFAAPEFDTGLLDGDTLWWREDSDWLSGGGDLDAIALDLDSGQSAPVGKVLWRSLGNADAYDVALVADGLLVEVRDSTVTVRDPFADQPEWTAPVEGRFRSATASDSVLAVVREPAHPRLFAPEGELELVVYALDDGHILGTQHFDPEKARHVLPMDDAALLVLGDDTSIRVGD